jgi:Glycosyl transferases group 1
MARGLPCIASAVGGIPELLPPGDLFPPADAAQLAAKIVDLISDADRLEQMSARNVLKAREFLEAILRERRLEFYRHLRRQTEDWVRRDASKTRGRPARCLGEFKCAFSTSSKPQTEQHGPHGKFPN